MSQDITESRQAEELLRESEEMLRQLFDNIINYLAVYQAVDDGDSFIFVDINRSGQTLSEISRDELIGKRVTDVFPAVEEIGLLRCFVVSGKQARHNISSYSAL